MKFTQLVLALGALGLGVSVSAISVQSASRSCASEECACEEALRQNTVEALEEFLRKYPQSTTHGNTACAALAVPPLNEEPDGQGLDDVRSPAEPSGSQSNG